VKKSLAIVMITAVMGLSMLTGEVLIPVGGPHPLVHDASVFQTGDILFIRGRTWRSFIVVLSQWNNSDFSHVGIVLIKDGVPYVIHATPEGMDRGTVISEPLREFLCSKEAAEAGLYRIREGLSDIAKEAAAAAERFAARVIPFDHEFDLLSSEKLYCTELIWLSYKKAGLDLLDRPLEEFGSIILPSALQDSRYVSEIARF